MNWRVLAVAVALVVAAAGAPATATGSGVAQAETVAGTHVSFGVTDSAVVDYTVDGDRLVEGVAVQAESRVDAGVTGELSGSFSGAGLTVSSDLEGSTHARVDAETGARIDVTDNDRGVLTVLAGERPHRVRFDTTADTTVRAVSDRRAVIESTNGTATAVVLVTRGDGTVAVSGGNVTVSVGTRGAVVFRQYEDGRTADDRRQESLIANASLGTAVYVDADGDGTRVSQIRYGGVNAEVTAEAGSGVELDAQRIFGGGSRPVLLSLSEAAFPDAGNATVTVDGETVAAADGYADLQGGGADFLIRESTSEPGRIDVLVDVESYPARISVRTDGEVTGDDGGAFGRQSSFSAPLHVAFEVDGDGIRNYTVDGRTVVSDLRVQTAGEARTAVGVDAGAELRADTAFPGAGLRLGTTATTGATVRSESGARIDVHDNDRGVVVVRPGGEPHVARFGGGEGATAERASERRAVLRRNGSSAAVIVVGEGNVSVGDGNVTARVGDGGRVVYRQYDGNRSASEREQERLIASGTAAAAVYLQPTAEESGAATERLTDVVRYGRNTTVEVTEESATRLTATVNRTERRGKVVLFSLQESVFENAGNATVTVDGEAAVRADSYAGIRSAVGGERSAFLVRSATSAETSVDVVVGINHFSARQVSIASGDGTPTSTPTPTPTDGTDEDTASDGGDGGDGTPSTAGGGDGTDGDTPDGGDGVDTTGSGGQPGFGAVTAVLALAGAALLARRRL